jgi:hypothetical protein
MSDKHKGSLMERTFSLFWIQRFRGDRWHHCVLPGIIGFGDNVTQIRKYTKLLVSLCISQSVLYPSLLFKILGSYILGLNDPDLLAIWLWVEFGQWYRWCKTEMGGKRNWSASCSYPYCQPVSAGQLPPTDASLWAPQAGPHPLQSRGGWKLPYAHSGTPVSCWGFNTQLTPPEVSTQLFSLTLDLWGLDTHLVSLYY